MDTRDRTEDSSSGMESQTETEGVVLTRAKSDLRRRPQPRTAPKTARRERLGYAPVESKHAFKLWCISAFAFCPLSGAGLRARPSHISVFFRLVSPVPCRPFIRSPLRLMTQEPQPQFFGFVMRPSGIGTGTQASAFRHPSLGRLSRLSNGGFTWQEGESVNVSRKHRIPVSFLFLPPYLGPSGSANLEDFAR